MNTKTLQQFEQSLIDDIFAALNQQAQTAPPSTGAPQAEPPRPYYAGKSQRLIEREQIEAQLRILIEVSAARVYEILMAQLIEMKAEQAQQAESDRVRVQAERKAWLLEVEQAARGYRRISSAPTDINFVSSRQDFYS